jgi:thiol-disulfide isomerase/thioredoxin|tara:strand:+ start:197 stop:676 length:480 start_codon:yes stop_codon:yes gene_type:complete
MSNSFADEVLDIKNLVIHKEFKKYDSLTFLNAQKDQLNLDDYKGNLILLNFWATWCLPCKEEMPSLDLLHQNKDLDNLKIFPINVGQENLEKTSIFFKDLKIENLKIYYDSSITLAKKLGLRGIPTTVLLNENGFEFARIVGSIDFNNREFIEWLKKYN